MKIEEEIKQEKFVNEYHKAWLNIIFTSGWLNTLTNAILKPYGISPQQYNVMRILKGQYPNPAMLGLIQERMLDKMSNATRLVDKLMQKGLVQRKQCEHNRRQVDILITKKGLDLLTELQPHFETGATNLKQITETEAKEINRILNKLRG